MRFFDLLFPPRADEQLVRDARLEDFLALVDPELAPLGGTNATALLPFTNPLVRAAVHEAKYHGNERAFNFLGTALADYLRDADYFCADETRFDLVTRSNLVLVPIPLGATRRHERGYNQAEEVAKRAGKELDIPLATDLLARTRDTISQVSLPKNERMKNMRGAFRAAHPVNSSHLYIVLDDVVTTGATLAEACSALKSAGAKNIIPLALAH